ncbi:MAG: gamma-glutamylcyclotransferase family protein [Pirellulaceae bacterium]|nr:gamma-glutamylcyclotransferase family protein [Pirellulaceae bacterium]
MNYWYFAYGSNLLATQMVARTGPIRTGDERPRIARLPNYRLTFNMLGEDGQVYANIVTPGDGVVGVIYRCGREALEKLDRFERGYERQKVLVIDGQGLQWGAMAYLARPHRVTSPGRPSAEYLQKILTGAREHGLPEEYVQAIETLAVSSAATAAK